MIILLTLLAMAWGGAGAWGDRAARRREAAGWRNLPGVSYVCIRGAGPESTTYDA